MKTDDVKVEIKFSAPVSVAWQALTDPGMMKLWYFDLPGFRAEKGYLFSFYGGPAPDRQYHHLCEVTEAIENRKLSYTWCYEGYKGSSLVTFELLPQGELTLLRLTHSGLGTFPEDEPDLAAKNFEEGWDQIINKSLKNYLEMH